MSMSEKITASGGMEIVIEKRKVADTVEVTLSMNAQRKCLLHWGLSGRINGPWRVPPASVWPEGSKAFGHTAVQTPFSGVNDQGRIRIKLGTKIDAFSITFVLFFPEESL